MKFAAIIPAAGTGKRLRRGTPKALVRIFGKPLLIHTLENIKRSFFFDEIVLAVEEKYRRAIRKLLDGYGLGRVRLVAGGRSRAESVKNALFSLPAGIDWVLVHDAARPLVNRGLVQGALRAARKTGASLCALPATATVKRVKAGSRRVLRTEDRRVLYLAQTPQVFRAAQLRKRYEALGSAAFDRTDDASLFDGSRVAVSLAPGQVRNLKITTPEDLELFKFYLKGR